jgi:hypothetical protein
MIAGIFFTIFFIAFFQNFTSLEMNFLATVIHWSAFYLTVVLSFSMMESKALKGKISHFIWQLCVCFILLKGYGRFYTFAQSIYDEHLFLLHGFFGFRYLLDFFTAIFLSFPMAIGLRGLSCKNVFTWGPAATLAIISVVLFQLSIPWYAGILVFIGFLVGFSKDEDVLPAQFPSTWLDLYFFGFIVISLISGFTGLIIAQAGFFLVFYTFTKIVLVGNERLREDFYFFLFVGVGALLVFGQTKSGLLISCVMCLVFMPLSTHPVKTISFWVQFALYFVFIIFLVFFSNYLAGWSLCWFFLLTANNIHVFAKRQNFQKILLAIFFMSYCFYQLPVDYAIGNKRLEQGPVLKKFGTFQRAQNKGDVYWKALKIKNWFDIQNDRNWAFLNILPEVSGHNGMFVLDLSKESQKQSKLETTTYSTYDFQSNASVKKLVYLSREKGMSRGFGLNIHKLSEFSRYRIWLDVFSEEQLGSWFVLMTNMDYEASQYVEIFTEILQIMGDARVIIRPEGIGVFSNLSPVLSYNNEILIYPVMKLTSLIGFLKEDFGTLRQLTQEMILRQLRTLLKKNKGQLPVDSLKEMSLYFYEHNMIEAALECVYLGMSMDSLEDGWSYFQYLLKGRVEEHPLYSGYGLWLSEGLSPQSQLLQMVFEKQALNEWPKNGKYLARISTKIKDSWLILAAEISGRRFKNADKLVKDMRVGRLSKRQKYIIRRYYIAKGRPDQASFFED